MPFYFRKSVSAGPFRFNFSKGGVGASIGIRGLRVGTGPRGHYVHAGRNGFYYRATLGRAGERPAPELQPLPAEQPTITLESGVAMVEVESGDVAAMRDEALEDVLNDINAKEQQFSMAALLGWGFGGIGLLAALASGGPGLVLMLLALPAWGVGRWLDSYRRTAVLFYEFDPGAEKAYTSLTLAFDGLCQCAAKWHVEAGGVVQDLTTWKRNAGATHIVRKKPTVLSYGLPRVVKCNVTPPLLHVGRQAIYLLPDMALVQDGSKFGAVSYRDLNIQWQTSNFIEDGNVPRDAQVIAHTWKHPNKSGGPDRRFRDNYQIPICLYEVMHLTSGSGLNELLEFSKTGVTAQFANAARAMPAGRSIGRLIHLPS